MLEIQILRRELYVAIAAMQAAQETVRSLTSERDRLRARLGRVLDALDPSVDLEPATSSADSPACNGGAK